MELFNELKNASIQVALVVDSMGIYKGIVALKDILYKIADEFDEDNIRHIKKSIKKSGNDYYADGTVALKDLNNYLKTNISADHKVTTIAGLFLERLKKVPDVGDSITAGGFIFTVTMRSERHIKQVHIAKITTQ